MGEEVVLLGAQHPLHVTILGHEATLVLLAATNVDRLLLPALRLLSSSSSSSQRWRQSQ